MLSLPAVQLVIQHVACLFADTLRWVSSSSLDPTQKQCTGKVQTAKLLQLTRLAAGACLLQEDDFADEEAWEDVGAPGLAAAGGSSQGGLLAGVPDDDEDWEDVL